MPVVTLDIAAMEDDGQWGAGTSFNNFGNTVVIGAVYGSSTNAFARFTGGPPQGSTINSAHLKVTARGTATDVATYIIKLCDEDASAQVADETDAQSRPVTSGTSWPVSAEWADEEVVDSVDFAAEVQAVVDRAGYSGVLQVMLGYNTDGFVSRSIRVDDGDTTDDYPQLVIDYTEGEGGGFQSAWANGANVLINGI